MSQFKQALSALSTFLAKGADFHAAFAAHTNKQGHAPAQLINEAARVVERKYGCHAELRESGWKFLDADGKKNEAAQRFWNRELRAYDATPMSKRGGARSQSVDAVAKQIDALLGKFSLEERRRIAKAIVKG